MWYSTVPACTCFVSRGWVWGAKGELWASQHPVEVLVLDLRYVAFGIYSALSRTVQRTSTSPTVTANAAKPKHVPSLQRTNEIAGILSSSIDPPESSRKLNAAGASSPIACQRPRGQKENRCHQGAGGPAEFKVKVFRYLK